MNGSNDVKIPLRSSANLEFEKEDKFFFILSILAYLHLCEKRHSNRVSNYRQKLDEVNIDGFDFSNGFMCSDVRKIEELKIMSLKKLN